MSRARVTHDGQGGYVFADTLIAAAILMLILMASYRVSAESVVRHRQTEARRYALMTARSRLAAVGSEIPLAPGATEGAGPDGVWRVDIASCGSAGRTALAGALYCITVTVGDKAGARPLITLNSRRLGA